MQVCTVAATNYLAYARVLARSLAREHGGLPLHVLVLDADVHEPAHEPFITIRPDELELDRGAFHVMAAIYNVLELATAVKPWLLRHLLKSGAASVVYLDPDIRIFGTIDRVDEMTKGHSLVLTPHNLTPIRRDGKSPTESDILLRGTYNLGFVAVGRQSGAFLDWWSDRLHRDCVDQLDQGLFVDQKWIDLAVHYFRHFVVRDPGWNVAYWNLDQRPLAIRDDKVLAADSPLRFFHFSGFDPRQPTVLCRYNTNAPRTKLADSQVAQELCRLYAAEVMEAGFAETAHRAYGFGTTAGGISLDRQLRRNFREALIADDPRARGIDPFAPGDIARFSAWIAADQRDRKRARRARLAHAIVRRGKRATRAAIGSFRDR
jgi:hypothetical protein